MEIGEIILYCSGCNPSKYVPIKAKQVGIVLNLKKDIYEFYATCPECGKEIYNTRRVFQ